jgi:hypothetical protein
MKRKKEKKKKLVVWKQMKGGTYGFDTKCKGKNGSAELQVILWLNEGRLKMIMGKNTVQ